MDKKHVMDVEGKPVYVGDKLLFDGENGQYVREVFEQHKSLAEIKPDWVKLWSWELKNKK